MGIFGLIREELEREKREFEKILTSLGIAENLQTLLSLSSLSYYRSTIRKKSGKEYEYYRLFGTNNQKKTVNIANFPVEPETEKKIHTLIRCWNRIKALEIWLENSERDELSLLERLRIAVRLIVGGNERKKVK